MPSFSSYVDALALSNPGANRIAFVLQKISLHATDRKHQLKVITLLAVYCSFADFVLHYVPKMH